MTAALRAFDLDERFETVAARAELRPPQRESLEIVHRIVRSLPVPLAQTPHADVARRARELRPAWRFPDDRLELTFALATGVGKTRLMGAIAAYLFGTGEAANFLFLASRDQILRKFEDELRESHPKYVFGDRSLVPQPRVCLRDNLLDFNPDRERTLFHDGPNVFVLSPQLLTSRGRVAQVSPLFGQSILEYLQQAEDLVVFVDEAHHLGERDREENARTWSQAVHDLGPKAVFSMTATPRAGVDVAYSYDLRQCLRDRLYTKGVRLVVDDRAKEMSDRDYDRFTLEAGLERLREKRDEIAELRERLPAFPSIRPVLLVAAKDTSHADEVYAWLTQERGMSEESVLLIHSRRRTEADLKALADLERPESPVDVVVQVHVLDEGWDVTNVWVIAPLRNVNSFVNARQIMGRGLRLPIGYRVGDDELDTLDVLAFGQQTIQQIIEEATAEFGADADVRVVRPGQTGGGMQTAVGDDEPTDVAMRRVVLEVTREARAEIPILRFLPPAPVLDIAIESLALAAGSMRAVDLSTLDADSIEGFRLPRDAFVRQTVDGVLQAFAPLSAPLHEDRLRSLVEGALARTVAPDASEVPLDPRRAVILLREALAAAYLALDPSFEATGLEEGWRVLPQEVRVAEDAADHLDHRGTSWSPAVQRQPLSGWTRCTHAAARFDSAPEYLLASRLDSMAGIDWWARNDPALFRFETIASDARSTAPDFLVMVDEGGQDELLFVEVKGEMLWSPGSDAQRHARDVAAWCSTAASATGLHFWSGVILGEDVDGIHTLKDLRDAAHQPGG